jgi:hypothetical protein
MRFALFAVALSAAVCSSAQAGRICRYEDTEGRTTYSSTPLRDQKLVSCGDVFPDEPPKPPPPSTAKPAPSKPPAPSAGSPSGFPRVDNDTQRRRDDVRRRVLEQELADEERLLVDAKRTLDDTLVASRYSGSDATQQRARLKPLEDAITRHTRNAEAIRRELATVR